jgi:serine protease Do
MHASNPRIWPWFLLSTVLATGLALCAMFLFKDAVIGKTAPQILTVIGKQPENPEATQLQAARDRVLPAVFAIVHRQSETATTAPRPFATAIGLTSDGYLLTALPLPLDAMFILPGLKPLPPQSVVKDEVLGLAIVKVDATRVPVVRFAESAYTEPGTRVDSISLDLIDATTMASNGVVDERLVVGANELLRRFRVSGSFVLPGSPVALGDGVLAVTVDTEHHLAVPSDLITPMISRFLKTKLVSHPLVAIDVQESDHSALVKRVKKGSAAEKAGLKIGDIIISVEGETVQESQRLAEILEDFEPTSTVEWVIKRGAAEVKLMVPLQETLKK